jgi:hypothetical protein
LTVDLYYFHGQILHASVTSGYNPRHRVDWHFLDDSPVVL